MAEATQFPPLGPFKLGVPLVLMPFPNGGWTIQQSGDYGDLPRPIGSFSNAADMLVALQACLGSTDPDVQHVR